MMSLAQLDTCTRLTSHARQYWDTQAIRKGGILESMTDR